MNAAWSGILNSTFNAPEMSRWPGGMNYRSQCNGTTNGWDYKLQWDSNPNNFGSPPIGGRIHHQAASSASCVAWGTTAPCGHRDYTQYDLTKFRASGSTYRQELIAHEQGHAHELRDLTPTSSPTCFSAPNSLMKNGINGCAWGGSFLGYKPYDRSDINATY